jgi:hypothetical protein
MSISEVTAGIAMIVQWRKESTWLVLYLFKLGACSVVGWKISAKLYQNLLRFV